MQNYVSGLAPATDLRSIFQEEKRKGRAKTRILKEPLRRMEKLLEVGVERQNHAAEFHYDFNSKNTHIHISNINTYK